MNLKTYDVEIGLNSDNEILIMQDDIYSGKQTIVLSPCQIDLLVNMIAKARIQSERNSNQDIEAD